MAQPLLVVVSGPPGSGTSTLAAQLARAIPCPAISRDEIKEGLVHAADDYTPAPGDELTRQASETFFGAVGFLIEAGVTVVAEAAFQHGLWAHGLEPLFDRASVRMVHCRTDAATARERIARRLDETPVRRAIHGDHSLDEPFESWKPKYESFEYVALDVPTLDVDTTDGYTPSLEKIVAFVNAGSR